MTDFTQIRYAVADGIATITLARADRLNAFTATMMAELIAAFDRTDADDAVRAVIVTGDGRAFCAGADLAQGAATFDYDNRAESGPKKVIHKDGRNDSRTDKPVSRQARDARHDRVERKPFKPKPVEFPTRKNVERSERRPAERKQATRQDYAELEKRAPRAAKPQRDAPSSARPERSERS